MLPNGNTMSETALARLLSLLDLEVVGTNAFRGLSPPEPVQRVFGGQVLAQALVAATRTVTSEWPCHSFHAYFLRPGDPKVPILYEVDRSRDGASFTARRVTAIQHGQQIFNMSASFQIPEEGLDHQLPMPDVPPPESLPDYAQSQFDTMQGGKNENQAAKKVAGGGTLPGHQRIVTGARG